MYHVLAELIIMAFVRESPEEKDLSLSAHEAEILQARRALRTAGWISVFYLITTDILGPFNAPYAFSQVGYVPGAILYIVMGIVACYTGLILSYLFCKLDSHRYPIRQYADLGGRIFGEWFRHICTFLQTIQLIIVVAIICLANGQSVQEIANNHGFCFAVEILIWPLVGMVIGQIRTLKSYGWLANASVWLNLLIIFTSMGFVAHSPPNYAAATAAYGISPGPIVRQRFVSQPIFAKVNGIMQMVYAYGGAMIFPEFMAEMKRPMDFWKAMICAQLLISTVYMMYGIYVYAFQGQFSLPLAYQGVSKYAWQTVGNVLALISGIIAAGLVGNIGVKIVYLHVVEEWVKGPPLLSTKGRLIWSAMVILYWSLAFIIGAAIPQVQNISGLVGAICVMQFTYSFPPIMLVGYQMIIGAAKNDPGDTWRQFSRWKRGFFAEQWYFKLFNVVMFLGALTMSGLGIYGSSLSIKTAFQTSSATSLGCTPPI